ncbi:MAG: hypothetical protein PUF39_02025, partial [Prevotellaceae bacterium]|nr:hypothetical protein [Prevotellaceae bacterium]
YDGHPLLFIYIPEFREKPMYLRGSDIYNSYIRSAGHTVRMSRQQVRLLIIADTVAKGLIKSSNPDSDSRKFVSYVPFYA